MGTEVDQGLSVPTPPERCLARTWPVRPNLSERSEPVRLGMHVAPPGARNHCGGTESSTDLLLSADSVKDVQGLTGPGNLTAGELFPGRHDPLISKELFLRVQDVLAKRARRGQRDRVHHHFPKGLLFAAPAPKMDVRADSSSLKSKAKDSSTTTSSAGVARKASAICLRDSGGELSTPKLKSRLQALTLERDHLEERLTRTDTDWREACRES